MIVENGVPRVTTLLESFLIFVQKRILFIILWIFPRIHTHILKDPFIALSRILRYGLNDNSLLFFCICTHAHNVYGVHKVAYENI